MTQLLSLWRHRTESGGAVISTAITDANEQEHSPGNTAAGFQVHIT